MRLTFVHAVCRRRTIRFGQVRRIRCAPDIAAIGVGEGDGIPLPIGVLHESEDFFLVRSAASDGWIPHASIGAVIRIVRIVDISEAIVGPRGRIPMLDDRRLIVSDAIRGHPFAGQNARTRGQVVRWIRGDALPVEGRVFPGMHTARDLTDSIAAIE